jgi:hypothetical protein
MKDEGGMMKWKAVRAGGVLLHSLFPLHNSDFVG